MHDPAFADDIAQPVAFPQFPVRLGQALPGPLEFGQVGNGFDHADGPALFVLDQPGAFHDGNVMAVLVPHKTFLGVHPAVFKDAAF